MYDGRCIRRYPDQQLLWSITFTYISSSRAVNRKAEVKQCQTQALFFVKKKPRGRVPLKWLSYEIALQIHCCRYISFLYVYWFCKIFGDIQHKVDWIQQISINTHFFTLMFFTMGAHLTDLPPVWKISDLSLTFLWEIDSYLTSKKHSFKPKGWIVCVTVNQEHWNRLLYSVSELA